ncbi:MAG TPA: HD domain-containing protein [Saprospiraceae bacterium]|nr:HD domain-containing protein [Saprospiraceae bacterium]HUN16985.1 HD domain-containing protein [Saprospiraceae bacterium]
MARIKIINDPVYGFISVPYGILLELIDHPYFQRLRRISQLGLSSIIYPGATHTRFHHALGAYHLMTKALQTLEMKGVELSSEEKEGACIAILLHDLGHGPFSHVLENILIPVEHERLTLLLMEDLNKQFGGKLNLAISIFKNEYPKKFLFQLVSSQLDMDRMDYLTRDSFYTGVSEGIIGYDRIIQMMNVVENQLVIEEKALFSIEKFLTARKIMYWQVYMHKASISAEIMLTALLSKIKENLVTDHLSEGMSYFILNQESINKVNITDEILLNFVKLDDTDIWTLVKSVITSHDIFMSYLAKGLLERQLLKVEIKNFLPEGDEIDKIRLKCVNLLGFSQNEANLIIRGGTLEMSTYNQSFDEIFVNSREKALIPLSEVLDLHHFSQNRLRYFISKPKELS